MPVKKVHVPDVGTVHLYKRRGTKSLRLSIAHNGEVRVSMPPWVPYRVGLEFAIKKRDWISKKKKAPVVFGDGQRIGKGHRLVFNFAPSSRVSSRITKNYDIRVTVPVGMDIQDESVQTAINRAATKALKHEAEALLPQRLQTLSTEHNLPYRSVSIKRLSSRWGSCSEHHDIVLNCYLMQLPWHLIDYVLLHELLHTQIMAHGPVFWDELAKHVPNLAAIRKEIRAYQPILMPQ